MDYFSPLSLLAKPPPTNRASYSDRTAWLMAQMSKLAYLKFEPPQENLIEIAKQLATTNDVKEVVALLATLIDQQSRISREGLDDLESELGTAKFTLVKPFNAGGTQAFLAKRDEDKIAVLSFRGTEATQIADIKADLNAIITNDSGARTHSGFRHAFDKVAREIVAEVKGLEGYALYITGHSLGGALALIATRELEGDKLAACYTFGSPRVGSSEFADPIKTPIYRVVNTADIVPRLPPGVFIEVGVDILRLLSGLLPVLEVIASWLDNKVSGYRHHGDMRYLTNSTMQDYSDVRLISNITFVDRWRRLIKSRVSLNRYLKDHSIDEYCKKLAAYTNKRT